MTSRLRIGIIVAVIGLLLIILGGFAVVRLYQQTVQRPEEETVVEDIILAQIVIANRDLPLGTLLTEEDLTIQLVPVEFTARDPIGAIADAAGKILKVDLVRGEMIFSHNLADPTAVTHDIAYILSETHVLVAVPPTDLMSREAVIRRGDIVDLYATIQTEIQTLDETNNTETTVTETITFDAMQRLDITAMVVDIITEDQSTQAEGNEDESLPRQNIDIKAYLLAMDPQNALVIKYLKDVGAIFDFVLRAPTSTAEFDLTPVTAEYLRELYGLEILP